MNWRAEIKGKNCVDDHQNIKQILQTKIKFCLKSVSPNENKRRNKKKLFLRCPNEKKVFVSFWPVIVL